MTGGASGIGQAMAAAFCREGMWVVIADIEQPALDHAVADLRSHGGNVIGVQTDVANPSDVEALRDETLRAFGAAHLICNNAGIGMAGGIADTPLERWRWALDVNLWGVIHGCHAFLPILKKQGEGHIVNTASIAALSGHAMLGAYTASKSAVVGLSECLYHELEAEHSPIGISVFCPGSIATNIRQSERNRPAHIPELPPRTDPTPGKTPITEIVSEMSAAEAARTILDGIRGERFYIFTHPELARDAIKARRKLMLEGLAPLKTAGNNTKPEAPNDQPA